MTLTRFCFEVFRGCFRIRIGCAQLSICVDEAQQTLKPFVMQGLSREIELKHCVTFRMVLSRSPESQRRLGSEFDAVLFPREDLHV